MSQRAIMLAVRDRLRTSIANGGLGYTEAQCEIQDSGEPPPGNPSQLFVAVTPGEWSSSNEETLTEVIGVQVVVTVRSAHMPIDRLGTQIFAGDTGDKLEVIVDKIKAKLHGDPGPRSSTDPLVYPVLTLANARLGPDYGGFVEPLRFRGCSKPQRCGHNWFGTKPQTGEPPGVVLGLSQSVIFGGAVRVQQIGGAS